jgi:hypothetical protein
MQAQEHIHHLNKAHNNEDVYDYDIIHHNMDSFLQQLLT